MGHGRLEGQDAERPADEDREPIHVPLNDAAVAAVRAAHSCGDERGRVFQSEKKGEPREK